jgi:transcriptional regulator with XRE-family HTH domain
MARLKSVLAHNIKTRRKSLGLTQETMAEKINTASTYIAMIESERRTPSFKMIERIAEVLEVDAPELFSTKDYPSESISQLHENLMSEFDKFLMASAKKFGEKGLS